MAVKLDDSFSEALERARHPEAEASVLGGCLMRPEILGWLELDDRDFWDPRHQGIFRALRALHEAGQGVDEVTVLSHLRAAGVTSGDLESYVPTLALRVPTTENVVHYAEIVRVHAANRRILLLAASVPQRFGDEISGEELLADVQRALSEIELHQHDDAVDLATAVHDELADIRAFLEAKARGENPYVGIPTGIGPLDERIGGIIVGAPSFLGARPAGGKSTFALNVALNSGSAHVFTYEDRAKVWAQRLLAIKSGVHADRIRARNFFHGDLARLAHAKDDVGKSLGVHIDHAHGMQVQAVIRRARGRRRELKTKLVIVDYLQLTPNPERGMKRHEALAANIKPFVEYAGKDDMAVLILSQLGREVGKEKRRPTLEDFRGTGDIEQDGKLIMALHSPDKGPMVECCLLKNHQGPEAVFDVPWDRATCRMG